MVILMMVAGPSYTCGGGGNYFCHQKRVGCHQVTFIMIIIIMIIMTISITMNIAMFIIVLNFVLVMKYFFGTVMVNIFIGSLITIIIVLSQQL